MQALPLTSGLNESIYFDYTPPPTFAGHINKHPFKVIITSSHDNPHVINLTSKYSKSYEPQGQTSKWSFLRAQNRFLDLSGNQIDKIITTDTPLYIGDNNTLNTVSGNFIGVSGYAEFYFVDDIYNYDFAFNDQKYSTIVALLQTSGINYFTSQSQHIQSSRYSNSKAIAYQPHVFHYRDPDYIKISENGIRDFINPRWVAADQHVVFSFNWNKQYSELFYDGNEIIPINFDSNFNKSIPSNTNTDTVYINSQMMNYEILSTLQQPYKISNSLDNFNKIIDSLDNVPKTSPTGNIPNTSYEDAANAILRYKTELQQQVVEYAKFYYLSALNTDSLSAKCFRDVGYIIDALTADLINNTNHRCVEVGDMYFKGTLMGSPNVDSNVPTLPQNQITATIDAISSLIYYINGTDIPTQPTPFTTTGILSTLELGSLRQNDIVSKINDIVYPLSNKGELSEYQPKGSPTKEDIQLANRILQNKTQIQDRVASYVDGQRYLSINNETIPDPVLSAKCKRDVGLMIDAVVHDLSTGVVAKSIQYALAYWEGSTSRLPENVIPFQKSKTLDTIRILENLIMEVYQNQSRGNIIKAYFKDDSIEIKYKNQDQYLSPGYCKTIFNVGNRSSIGVALTASSEFNSPNTQGNLYSPKMWLSNPNAGVMGIVEYNFPKNYDLDSKLLQKAQIYNFEVPIVYEPNLLNDRFSTIGFHGINSIAVLPPPNHMAWAVDGELNYLYKFGTNGKILSAIDLVPLVEQYFGILVYDQVSPTSIVLDSRQNMWITLYDNRFVLNIDKEGNLIAGLDLSQQVEYVTPPDIDVDWYEKNQPYPTDEETQNFVEPTIVDTDSSDNIWVTYSNYASGYLLKFDYNNNILQTISYPVCSCPQDIIVNNQDDIWVALSNNIWRSFGTIEKRDTNGILLSTFGPVMGLNELTLDPNQNLWFTYSYSRIGCIDNITGTVSTFNVLDNSENSHYAQKPYVSSPNINTDETALEGIACDLKGYLYVINSVENQVYIYNTNTKTYVDKFYVNPQGFTFWTKSEAGDTEIEYNQWSKSLQAHGDWMGTKWINKYYKKPYTYKTAISGSTNRLEYITVTSKNLNPDYSFLASSFYKHIKTNYYEKILVTPKTTMEPISINDNLDIFKINENYDLGNQIKSFALTPTLQDSPFLFDKFLPSIYGVYPYEHSDFGIFSYEKIANFVLNNSDIDTCEIDKLYSMSDATNNNTDDFLLNYPTEIKRLMDLLSINQTRLWGSVQKNQNNFKEPGINGEFNRGQKLTLNYMITAGIPVILKTKSLDKYELVNTGPLFNINIYSLNNLINTIGINDNGNWEDYYEFYEFIPSDSTIYSDNIIDWNNTQTTISKNLSTAFEWVGDEQNIDKLFSYYLYTGLGIF
jgi:hypothetical protein